MTSASLENRIAAVEAEISEIKKQLAGDSTPWWERLAGAFENDPIFDSAMARGAEYRKSLPSAADEDADNVSA